LSEQYELRPTTPEDRDFLLEVYASTRVDELALVDWDAEQKLAFLTMQLDAQERHYRGTYRNATFDVVVMEGQRAGRLYVARWDAEIRIIDISLLPECRGRGIGTAVLDDLLQEATTASKPVTIHVEHGNRALGLYERLGFVQTSVLDTHVLMERRPADQANTAS
jgi:ribosomal protein S18 acetylase RimI-like enzyme